MKKRNLSKFITAILIASSIFYAYAADIKPITKIHSQQSPTFSTAFSPKQGATTLIIQTIREAKQSILVAAYSFTSKPIAYELSSAQKRGVQVKIVLDKSQLHERYSLLNLLLEKGIDTRVNHHYSIMHNKFMIIDGKTLQLGSFNYSNAAEERNAENVLVIHNQQELVDAYFMQWQKLWHESV